MAASGNYSSRTAYIPPTRGIKPYVVHYPDYALCKELFYKFVVYTCIFNFAIFIGELYYIFGENFGDDIQTFPLWLELPGYFSVDDDGPSDREG